MTVIRNETFVSSVCVRADIIDLDAATRSIEINGEIVETRPLTADEIAALGLMS